MAKASATGRVLDVAAPDVEQPGDGIEHGEKDGVGLLGRERGLHVADLFLRRAPGIFDAVGNDRRRGRLRPILPDRVDEIGFDRDELDARLGERLGQPIDFLDGVQRRVVADRAASAELLGDPVRGLGLRRLQHLEQRRVGLGARLEDVTPVNEQRRVFVEHHRRPGRAGEAREPGEALELGGEILVLVLVAVGDEQALELSRLQLALEGLDTLGARPGRTDIVEQLKHGWSLYAEKAAAINLRPGAH